MKKYILNIVAVLLFFSCEIAKKQQVQYLESPAKTGSMFPYLFSNQHKTLLSWVQKESDSLYSLQYAELLKGKWTAPKKINTGNDWFLNWADFPAIAENNGQILSHVLKKSSPKTFSYNIMLNWFNKGENSWKKDFILHHDATKTEHGFVSILPYKKNSFFVTWLDGRNTGGGGHGNHDTHNGAMTVRAAEISAAGEIINKALLDNKTCDCCQTTAAITSNGPVVIYRDRTDEEIRDMSIVRWVNGKWTSPKAIFEDGWKIAGCPVNGPKAAAINNHLAVAWFTAANGMPKVNLMFSNDGGAHFNKPINISNIKPMGRVDVAMIDTENVLVSWMEAVENEAQIKAVKVHRSGKKSPPLTITSLKAVRKTGFPQMEIVGEKVYFAWTSLQQNTSFVKTVRVLLKEF